MWLSVALAFDSSLERLLISKLPPALSVVKLIVSGTPSSLWAKEPSLGLFTFDELLYCVLKHQKAIFYQTRSEKPIVVCYFCPHWTIFLPLGDLKPVFGTHTVFVFRHALKSSRSTTTAKLNAPPDITSVWLLLFCRDTCRFKSLVRFLVLVLALCGEVAFKKLGEYETWKKKKEGRIEEHDRDRELGLEGSGHRICREGCSGTHVLVSAADWIGNTAQWPWEAIQSHHKSLKHIVPGANRCKNKKGCVLGMDVQAASWDAEYTHWHPAQRVSIVNCRQTVRAS